MSRQEVMDKALRIVSKAARLFNRDPEDAAEFVDAAAEIEEVWCLSRELINELQQSGAYRDKEEQ